MKKLLVVIFAMIFCASLLTNCAEGKEHEHVWVRIGGDRYIWVKKCTKCDLYKDFSPKACWEAVYADGEVTLKDPILERDSAIELVAIEEFIIRNEGYDDSFADITLRIRANESKTYRAYIQSYQSGDNLGEDFYEDLVLTQGEETTVNFEVWGFYNTFYHVAIEIDNSVFIFRINP